jgi:predicted transcriptional regulator
MPVDLSKTKRFAVNLPIDLAEEVERLAKADRRPAAAWLRNAIEDAVKAAKPTEG